MNRGKWAVTSGPEPEKTKTTSPITWIEGGTTITAYYIQRDLHWRKIAINQHPYRGVVKQASITTRDEGNQEGWVAIELGIELVPITPLPDPAHYAYRASTKIRELLQGSLNQELHSMRVDRLELWTAPIPGSPELSNHYYTILLGTTPLISLPDEVDRIPLLHPMSEFLVSVAGDGLKGD